MIECVPTGARAVARVLLLSELNRLLLLQAREGNIEFWVTPGGGLEAGESFEEAARRELLEETGLMIPLGPCVWSRRHIYPWEGRTCDQYERFFVARAAIEEIAAIQPDRYVVTHRWWSLAEIEAATAIFAPRQLAYLLPPILRDEYPAQVIDCGV